MKSISKQEVMDELLAHGITPTQQRVLIAQTLFARPQHLSADQVMEIVNEDEAHVSKATVYNTLNLFARNGMVREVIVDPSKVFYDSNTAEHFHLYDVETGMLTDVPAGAIQVSGMPLLPMGTEALGIDVIIRVRSGS